MLHAVLCTITFTSGAEFIKGSARVLFVTALPAPCSCRSACIGKQTQSRPSSVVREPFRFKLVPQGLQ